jgi:FMN phosphatase YigB (HAD superfamily)
MAHPNVKIRAVIFDVYATLLEVRPPPADAELRWKKLFEELLSLPPPFSRTDFAARVGQVIATRHAEAKARGIAWPEILWPEVLVEVLPALKKLAPAEFKQFIARQMALGRTLRLASGAAACLRMLRTARSVLGIASNAQAYTLDELDLALGAESLHLDVFDPELCFWSFQNGFSKPDPHVFRILTTRLQQHGIRVEETLMVGDRLDNDIEPARKFGWQAWQITKPGEPGDGGWTELRNHLENVVVRSSQT